MQKSRRARLGGVSDARRRWWCATRPSASQLSQWLADAKDAAIEAFDFKSNKDALNLIKPYFSTKPTLLLSTANGGNKPSLPNAVPQHFASAEKLALRERPIPAVHSAPYRLKEIFALLTFTKLTTNLRTPSN